jgi:hypothetical protein
MRVILSIIRKSIDFLSHLVTEAADLRWSRAADDGKESEDCRNRVAGT